jgi:hypothetical protein
MALVSRGFEKADSYRSRFFAKARPEDDLRYRSKATAFSVSENAK